MAEMTVKRDRNDVDDRGGGNGGRGTFASLKSSLEDDEEEEERYDDNLDHGVKNRGTGCVDRGNSSSRDQKMKRSNKSSSSRSSPTPSAATIISRKTKRNAIATTGAGTNGDGNGKGILSMWKDNNDYCGINEPIIGMEDYYTAVAAKKKEDLSVAKDSKHWQHTQHFENDSDEHDEEGNDGDVVRGEWEENTKAYFQQQEQQNQSQRKFLDRHQHYINFGNEGDSLQPSNAEPVVAKKKQKNSKRLDRSDEGRQKIQEASEPQAEEHRKLKIQKETTKDKSLRPRVSRGRLLQDDYYDHHQQQNEEGKEESFKLIEPSPPDFDFCAQDDDDDDDDDDDGDGNVDESNNTNQVIHDESLDFFREDDAQPPGVTQRYGEPKLKEKRKSMPSQPQIQQGLEKERKKHRRMSDPIGNRGQSWDRNDLASSSTNNKKRFDGNDLVEAKSVRSKSVVGLRPSHWARDSNQRKNDSPARPTSGDGKDSNNRRLSRAAILAAATRKRTPKQKKPKSTRPTKDSVSSNERQTDKNNILQTPRGKTRTSDQLDTTSNAKSDIKKDSGFSISFAPAFIHRTAIKAARGGDALVDNDEDNGTGVHWTAPPTRKTDMLSPPPSVGKRRQVSNGPWARRLASLQLPRTHPSLTRKDYVVELEAHLNHIVASATTNTDHNSSWAEDQENLNNLLNYLNGLVGTALLHAAIVLLDTALADVQNHQVNQKSEVNAIESECLFTKLTAPSGRCVHLVRGSKGEETYLCLLSKQSKTIESTANQNDNASLVSKPTTSSTSTRRPTDYCTCRSFFDKATKPESFQCEPATMPVQYQSPLCKHLLALKLVHVLDACSGSSESVSGKFVKNERASTETEFSKLILDRTMGY